MNRRLAALLALPALAALSLAAAAAATAPPAAAETMACAGVTVVVDFTDIGGAVETGCAEGDPASGREALESAGFTVTDDESGLICAIGSQPADPCGAFEGSYWAYWQVADGEWVASQVGADQADPAPGAVEGWRYNDGSVPPPLLEGTEPEVTEPTSDDAPTSASTDDATTPAAADDSDGGGIGVGVWVAIGVVVAAAVVGLVLRRQRSQGS